MRELSAEPACTCTRVPFGRAGHGLHTVALYGAFAHHCRGGVRNAVGPPVLRNTLILRSRAMARRLEGWAHNSIILRDARKRAPQDEAGS